jgi:hypothetical protein
LKKKSIDIHDQTTTPKVSNKSLNNLFHHSPTNNFKIANDKKPKPLALLFVNE